MTESVYDQVHREFLERAKDPGWLMALEIYLGELTQEIALYHQAHIQAAADQSAMRQITKAKTQITKSYLEMRLVEIRKANKDDFKEGNWQREHGRFARWVGPAQSRENAHGSPAQDYHQVVRDEFGRLPLHQQQTPQRIVGLLGRPTELDVGVSDAEHKADVIQRNARMVSDLESKTNDPRNKQRVQFFVTNRDGRSRIITPPAGAVPGQGTERHQIDWEGGERVQYMTPVGPDHPVMVAGHALNLGHVIGMPPESAAKLGSVAQDLHDTINSTSWGKRLQAAANATRVISNNHPVAVQAHAVATLANLIGPDAARAFGPKLKQLTYRYSGQEASPEQYSEPAKAGRGQGESIRGYENRLAQDLAESLPTQRDYAASLQAGSTPPSRGFILNKNGKVVSEAVGFSDDWYAPFNLRKLPNLKGGSYVRSRGYGGITPEDLRLAMRTGAKRVTVVSNNGTFTMEFEPKALHWGHRFGFGGGAMIRRYTKSLDAVKHNRVIDPETGQTMGLNSKGYLAAMHDLKMKYPYWIAAPAQSGVPYHEPLRGTTRGVEAQGDLNDDKGYVKPLSINANGAMAGWAEPGHRELWTDAPSDKYAYDTISRFQLQQDALARVRRFHAGEGTTATAASTGNAAKPTGGTGSGVAGSGRSQMTAYREAQQEKLTNKQVGDMFAELRGIMKRGEETGIPEKDINDTDHVSRLHTVLMAPSRNDAEYAKLREEFANNPDRRRAMLDEMDDVYGERVDGAKSLLANMASEVNDSDEDQGAAAAAEQGPAYDENDHIPHAAFSSSPAYQRFMHGLAGKADDENLDAEQRAQAKALHEKMTWHNNTARQIEDIQRQGKGFAFTNDQHERRFGEANAVVARILNDERAREEDTGDRGDDGARTSTQGRDITIKPTDFIMRNPVEDIAAEHEADSYEDYGNDDDGQLAYLDRVEAAYRRASTRHHKQGNSQLARKLEEVANELSRRREQTEQYNRLSTNMENPDA